MTAEPPKKRAWFQLHLSTCVVLMVVVGALSLLNTIPGQEPGVADSKMFVDDFDGETWLGYTTMYGWPWPFTKAGRYKPYNASRGEMYTEARITKRALAADICVWLAVLGGVALSCEWAIRRRARRNQPN